VIGIVVTGAAGRMGSEIVRAVRAAEGVRIVAGTEQVGNAAVGLDVGLAARIGRLEAPTLDSLDKALALKPEVVIDFTSAEASLLHAADCARTKTALVVGSTGFSPDDKKAMAAAAKFVPIVMAPNMSVGVNLLFKLVADAARVLGQDYEPEIVELHHRLKKDAPSGTAMRLAEVIADETARDFQKDVVYGRRGVTGERPRAQLGVSTVRGGDVVGEHTVYFFGEGERLELTHRASSRDQFARGAVRAAKWAAGKPPGLYDMQDVLGLR
jgi:4-hydroxy-tetrahydrodipicolinate reductase